VPSKYFAYMGSRIRFLAVSRARRHNSGRLARRNYRKEWKLCNSCRSRPASDLPRNTHTQRCVLQTIDRVAQLGTLTVVETKP